MVHGCQYVPYMSGFRIKNTPYKDQTYFYRYCFVHILFRDGGNYILVV